jgi:hypothetical protein
MTWIKWMFAYLFDCAHLKTSWPQRGRNGLDYVCCLECGKEFSYSTRLMSIVTKDDQLLRPTAAGSGLRTTILAEQAFISRQLSLRTPQAWTPGATADLPGNLALRIELFVSGRVSLARLCRQDQLSDLRSIENY